MNDSKRAVGAAAEERAAAYMEALGYRVMVRNFSCLGGELDIVCQRDTSLVFVEVKYRKNVCRSRPAEAVNAKKRMCLSRAVGAYLCGIGGWEGSLRFDVIEIAGDGTLTHLENAFTPEGF